MNTIMVEYQSEEPKVMQNELSYQLRSRSIWKVENKHGFRVYQNLKKENYDASGLNRLSCEYTYHIEFVNKVMTVNNGKYYLKSIAEKHKSYVSLNSSVIGGMPAIASRRIPISLIIACFRDGLSIQDICEDYNLSSEQVKASLNYAIDVLDFPFHEE